MAITADFPDSRVLTPVIQEDEVPQNTLEGLPTELSIKIFSYLDPIEQQQFAQVSKKCNAVVKAVVIPKVSERKQPIIHFIQSLIQNLDADAPSKTIVALERIKKNVESLNSTNLKSLELYILDVKEQLIDEIKELNYNTIEAFSQNIDPIPCMEGIFRMSKIYRQVASSENKIENGRILELLVQDLLWFEDNIRRAIQVEEMIQSDGFRMRAIVEICRYLSVQADSWVVEVKSDQSLFTVFIRAIQLKKAIAMTETIPEADIKQALLEKIFISLQNLSRVLTDIGAMEMAIKVARMISDPLWQGTALWRIVSVLADKGEMEEAIKIATTISDQARRRCAFRDLLHIFTQTHGVEQAIECARKISEQFQQCHVLVDIALALTEIALDLKDIGLLRSALSTAREISDRSSQSRVLQIIARVAKNMFRQPEIADEAQSLTSAESKV